MKIREIISAIEEFAPRSCAAEWDNVGVMLGDVSRECTGVAVCLDCTEETVSAAAENGCNLIVSHHPFVFKPLYDLELVTDKARTAEAAFKNDVTIYSAHTNLDVAERGLSVSLAEMFGGKDTERFEFGCYASVAPCTAAELARRVSAVLGDRGVRVCNPDAMVNRIYVVSGSGGSQEELEAAAKEGAALVTAQVRHETYVKAYAEKIPVVEFSHYYSEIICCDIFSDIIKSRFGELKVVEQQRRCPYDTLEEL